MFLRTETISPKKLVGKHLDMSMATMHRTPELWRSFMPRRKEITNAVSPIFYSLQVLPPGYYERFNPQAEFQKWAAVEVSDFDHVPEDMETLELPGGLYAVFHHKGPASEGPRTFQYIFGTWIPNSEYVVDDRPHFEPLDEKYRSDDPDAEEEIWIPVKLKS